MGQLVWLLAGKLEPRGSTSYTLRLARGLAEHGFDPIVVCRSASNLNPKSLNGIRFVAAKRIEGRLFRALFPKWWRGMLPAEHPVLIHAQQRELDRLALDLAERFECPYLLTIQDFLPGESSLAILPSHLGAVIAISPSIGRDLVSAASVPQDLVEVIPGGVEVQEAMTLPPPRSDRKIPVVGTACALEQTKGLTYFLMAAELILSAGHDVEFVVAGSGPEEETLRRAAQHLDIANRVTFAPYLADYRYILETFDVFVLPSLEQGLGTIMFEAMALGVPVVATRVGGVRDFCVDGTHALLVPPANHVALADKIRQLLDNPAKARRLAIAGREMVRRDLSLDRMTTATVDLYRRVLDHFQPGGPPRRARAPARAEA